MKRLLAALIAAAGIFLGALCNFPASAYPVGETVSLSSGLMVLKCETPPNLPAQCELLQPNTQNIDVHIYFLDDGSMHGTFQHDGVAAAGTFHEGLIDIRKRQGLFTITAMVYSFSENENLRMSKFTLSVRSPNSISPAYLIGDGIRIGNLSYNPVLFLAPENTPLEPIPELK